MSENLTLLCRRHSASLSDLRSIGSISNIVDEANVGLITRCEQSPDGGLTKCCKLDRMARIGLTARVELLVLDIISYLERARLRLADTNLYPNVQY